MLFLLIQVWSWISWAHDFRDGQPDLLQVVIGLKLTYKPLKSLTGIVIPDFFACLIASHHQLKHVWKRSFRGQGGAQHAEPGALPAPAALASPGPPPNQQHGGQLGEQCWGWQWENPFYGEHPVLKCCLCHVWPYVPKWPRERGCRHPEEHHDLGPVGGAAALRCSDDCHGQQP